MLAGRSGAPVANAGREREAVETLWMAGFSQNAGVGRVGGSALQVHSQRVGGRHEEVQQHLAAALAAQALGVLQQHQLGCSQQGSWGRGQCAGLGMGQCRSGEAG